MRTFKLKYIDTLLLIEYDGQKRTISVTDSQSTRVEFRLTKMDGRYEGRLSDILGIFTGILNEITAIDEFDQVDRFTPWKSEYGCGDDQLDLAWFNLQAARWTDIQKIPLFSNDWKRKEIYEFCDSLLHTLQNNDL